MSAGPHVIVVGAGLAGLSCALELSAAGCGVEVFEGADRVGGGRETACLYFAAERPPVEEPVLVLNGDGGGPVNNLCVPSAVAPSYAPLGASLVSASVVEGAALRLPDARLGEMVREQLAGWFGRDVGGWRLLRTYRIARALPEQTRVKLCTPERTRTAARGVYVCGDHLDTASINGAMRAGRMAAEAVAADLPGAARAGHSAKR